MQHAAENLTFTAPELMKINCVRLFLCVTFLSEISTTDGIRIATEITDPKFHPELVGGSETMPATKERLEERDRT